MRGSLGRRRAAIVGEQRVHEIPEDVIGGDVAFLDAVDRGRRHDQAMIDEPLDFILPPSPPARPIVAMPISLALAKAGDQVGGIAAGRDADQPSPARALRDDLADEDMLEADDRCRPPRSSRDRRRD